MWSRDLALRFRRADRAPHLLRAIRLILAPSVTLVPTPPEQTRATRPTFAVTGHQLAIGDEVPGKLVGRLDVDARDPACARIELDLAVSTYERRIRSRLKEIAGGEIVRAVLVGQRVHEEAVRPCRRGERVTDSGLRSWGAGPCGCRRVTRLARVRPERSRAPRP